MQNQIRNQMMDLDPIKQKQIAEEFRNREGKTALDELLKQDKLIDILVGKRMRARFPPLNYFASLK